MEADHERQRREAKDRLDKEAKEKEKEMDKEAIARWRAAEEKRLEEQLKEKEKQKLLLLRQLELRKRQVSIPFHERYGLSLSRPVAVAINRDRASIVPLLQAAARVQQDKERATESEHLAQVRGLGADQQLLIHATNRTRCCVCKGGRSS